MSRIDNFPIEPEFTIKAVQNRTGIKPVTLRAWERRYDLLEPVRMPNGYRLYSERDIQLLMWVQRRVNSGISISQVVQQFNQIREKANGPKAFRLSTMPNRANKPSPSHDYAEMMFGALVSHNDERATIIFEECQIYFDLITIFQEVLEPALELLEEAWYVGDIPIATRHMAARSSRGACSESCKACPSSKKAR